MTEPVLTAGEPLLNCAHYNRQYMLPVLCVERGSERRGVIIMGDITMATLATAMLVVNAFAFSADAQTLCTGRHEWWDGKSCQSCTTASCSIGMFRSTCDASSVRDAVCMPCTMPPTNAVHITGGLPYLEDNCMWTCRENFYRKDDACLPCNRTACAEPFTVREACQLGATHDAVCVCPVDHYMLVENPPDAAGTQRCEPCAHAACESPMYETLVRCTGSSRKDVSRCVQNVVQPAA